MKLRRANWASNGKRCQKLVRRPPPSLLASLAMAQCQLEIALMPATKNPTPTAARISSS